MTEEEWLSTTDWRAMLTSLGRDVRNRQLRLLLVGGCHASKTQATSPLTINAISILEEIADGIIPTTNLKTAEAMTAEAIYEALAADVIDIVANRASANFHSTGGTPPIVYDGVEGLDSLEVNVPTLIRDIFGNPFRPVAFVSEWRTSIVVGLAQSMYESREFSPMPILADALEEAGCDHAEVLAHCRGENAVHVRGCWVVDLVLGKA